MPSTIKIDDHLFSGGVHEDRLAQTYLGMAHIAGTGPSGSRCRGCANWSRDAKDWKRTKAKDAYCTYPISGKRHRMIPGSAAACRFFKPLEN